MNRSEIAARAGVGVTGAGVGTSFIAQALPYVQFTAAIIALLVGCATLAYYVLAGVEKWRNLRNK